MSSMKLYTLIFALLMVMSSVQAGLEMTGMLEEMYWVTLGLIMALSFTKAVFVAGYYQHLVEEPRSVTYLVVAGLLAVLALTTAAAYSIL